MVDRDIRTLTVLGSQIVARADRRTAIVLTTKEQGAIAFEVTLEAIEVLRRELALAETILRQMPGKA